MPSDFERSQRHVVIDNLLRTPIFKPSTCDGCAYYQGAIYGGVVLNCEYWHEPHDVPENCPHRVE